MQIAEHDVPLGITTSIKKVLEDHHVKVLFTNIMKESPFGDDAPDDVFCTELLILYDSKQPPVKVDVYHNNTNEGFAQSFNLQIWLPWRRGLSDEKKIKALCSRFDIKTPKLANKAFNKAIFNIDSGFFNRLTQLSFVKQLCMIVRFNNLKSQVKLGIKIVKKRKVPYQQSYVYYLRIFIADEDVTFSVAHALDKPLSNAKDTNGAVIIHGDSMDETFYRIQHEISNMAKEVVRPTIFHDNQYIIK